MPAGLGIQSIGTPTQTLVTATPATSAWGTGQNRTAGHLLVAAIQCAQTTAGTIAITAPGSWLAIDNAIRNNSTTSNAEVGFWGLIATGGDAAPSFTVTTAGTFAGAVTLFEFTNVNMSNTQGFALGGCEATGTYTSGGVAGTLAFNATTATNVTLPGSYALYATAMERATATNTWTAPGGFTNVVNNGATNSIGHFSVDFKASPPVGATLNATGAWTTETTAFGTSQVMVLQSLQAPSATPSGQDDLQGNTCSTSQAITTASMW